MARAFFGGVHPKGEKELSRDAAPVPIRPKTVTIFLSQHIGAPCRPLVRVGDRVTLGQRLGDGEGLCAPVHASVSGTVVAVEPRPHPGGTDMPAVVLENDGRDTLCPTIQKRASPLTLPPDELIAIIREAGITGMGGAGFPTNVKLSSGIGKVDTVIINGAECEPYITSDDRLMRETPERIVRGLAIVQKILQPKKTVIGVEANKPEAIASRLENDEIAFSPENVHEADFIIDTDDRPIEVIAKQIYALYQAELKKLSQSCFRVDAFPGDRLLNRLLFGGVGVLHFRGFGEVSVFNQHRDQPFQCVRVVAIRGSIAVDRHAADVICVGRGEPVHRGGAGQLRNRADHLLAVRGVRLKCHA